MASAAKVGLVTGGAQGIGKAITRVLLKDGYKVAILDMNEAVGKETAETFCSEFGSGSCVFYKCDVTKTGDLKRCFSEATDCLGIPSVVVNNAGIADEENWTKVLDVNLKAYIDLTYIAVDAMRKDKGGNGGTIVFLASSAGMSPVTGTPVYCASKTAIIGFVRSMVASLALANEDWGISMLTLCPYAVSTSFGQSPPPPGVVRQSPAEGIVMSLAVPQAECRQVFVDFVKNTGILSLEEIGDAFRKLWKDNKNGSVMTANKEESGMKLKYMVQEWKEDN